jgi:hypothetical protein
VTAFLWLEALATAPNSGYPGRVRIACQSGETLSFEIRDAYILSELRAKVLMFITRVLQFSNVSQGSNRDFLKALNQPLQFR